MRQLFIYILLIFVSGKLLAEPSLQQKAEKSYAEKNYKETIVLYEGLIKQDYTSFKLFYNLGNAYYKNNELGKAIFNYERANKLKPNNVDINFNLQIARKKLIDDIDSKENFFIDTVKNNVVNTLSTKSWAYISIVSLLFCLTCAFIFFVSTKIIVKRLGFFAGILFLISFTLSLFLGYTALKHKQEKTFAIITNRETKIYDEPNAIATSKFTLHEGTKVKVIDSNTEWTNIKLENSNEGWVKTQHIGVY